MLFLYRLEQKCSPNLITGERFAARLYRLRETHKLGGEGMILCLTAKTDIPEMVIDFIEVKLQSGQTVSLTWD